MTDPSSATPSADRPASGLTTPAPATGDEAVDRALAPADAARRRMLAGEGEHPESVVSDAAQAVATAHRALQEQLRGEPSG